jgi:succinate-semialdehyde dehydrogenase/glutarate-semialdehyde dehydrogenase
MGVCIGEIGFSLNNPTLLSATTLAPGDKTFNVVNPGSWDGREVVAKCRVMDQSDAKAVIDASAAALPKWRDETTCLHRSKILTRWSDEIKDNLEDVATVMTMESGKPLAESKGEVLYACSFLDYYAGEALRPTSAGGGFIAPTTFATPEGAPRGQIMAIQEAVGVCGMVTPWNFPAAMITRKVGPALAAGCTAVVKPSELTPLTAIALRELGKKAGIPDGVFELVVADTETTAAVGAEFCSNRKVQKISFTGSVAVGKLLARQSADTVKKVSLELGGNAPFIVFDDADLDIAVASAVASKFRHAGQTCVCADRLLVHQSVHDEFVSKFVAAVEKLKVDQGMKEETTMGPLITRKAVESVEAKVTEAISEGGKCLTGGSALTEVGANFFEPTIITNVDTNSRLWKEETFGPVAAIRSFGTEEEAIELANDCSVGLASYLCSRDLSRVFRVARMIQSGIVGLNDGIISTASAPFGGIKESGLGREGSPMGIGEYLETKYMFVNA